MVLSRNASTEESEDSNPLSRYREAFVRNYQQYFKQFSTEEQRIEAANQLFNSLKTSSELAKIAITLKLITTSQAITPISFQPIQASQCVQQEDSKTEDSKQEESTSSQGETDMREKPAQNKLAREIEIINQRIQELYELRKLRELNVIEQSEVRNALTEREELRKRLKKTQDAAIRAKRYRIRKATLMSTDSDYASLDTAEPAFKFSRSLSTNVLINSDEDPQINNKHKDFLMIRTSHSNFTSVDDPRFLRESSNCLTVTPTPELRNLNISPIFIKTESNDPNIIALDYRPSSVCSTSANKTRISTTEEENSPNNTIKPQCQQCNSSFTNLNEFIDHMRTTHLNNNNVDLHCRICDRMFSSQQEKLTHLIEHYICTKAAYKCQDCERSFLNSTAFKQHFVSTHTELLFRCNVCLQIFTDNSIYQEHIISHANEETTIKCIICELGFDGPESFATHIQVVHESAERVDSNVVNNQTIMVQQKMHTLERLQKIQKNGSVDEAVKVSKNLKCFVCDEKYSNEQELDTHRLLNHCKVPKSDRCAVCHQALANLEEFFTHTKEHCTDLNEVNCVICRQTVRNETLLKMHGEYHLGNEMAQYTVCQICSKTVSFDTLAQHILQHTFETGDSECSPSSELFVCQCGQKFEDSNELQIHSLVHLKEVTSIDGSQSSESKKDPFVCPKCPKAFPTLSSLQGHSHVHTSRKFSCKQCRQCFSTLNRLMCHQKRHVNEKIKCLICDKRFQSQDSLETHMQAHESKIHSNTPVSPTT